MPCRYAFTDFTFSKGVLYVVCAIYVLCSALAVLLEPYMTLTCDQPPTALGTFPNVLYTHNPCRDSTRYLKLMGMTPQECIYGRHFVVALLLGGLIGYERRMADRPAGMRTMSLVSLASALFTVDSTFVFMAGPMHWDPARVSAAIPSGVGFLGAGLIVKDMFKDDDGETVHTVKGLNTAASVWLSAAVGVACGGGMYFVATYTAALMLVLLRFGPRAHVAREDSVVGLGISTENGLPSLPVLHMKHSVDSTVEIRASKSGGRKSAKPSALNF